MEVSRSVLPWIAKIIASLCGGRGKPKGPRVYMGVSES